MFYEVCTGVGLWLVVVVVLLLEVPCCFGGVAMLCSKGGEDGRSFLLASLLCSAIFGEEGLLGLIIFVPTHEQREYKTILTHICLKPGKVQFSQPGCMVCST